LIPAAWATKARAVVATGLLVVAGCGQAAPPSASPGASAGGSPGALGASGAPPASASADDSGGVAGQAPVCGPLPPVAAPPTLGQPGWWRDQTFYEVFVRSFADSDGDGIGDLRGLTAKLDALNDGDPSTHDDLGVGGLWLMPVFPSPSYHGYDVTDYHDVNRDYGSLADLRKLVAAAHARGMGVILDLPVNHTSNEDPWFVASRTGKGSRADWYVWSDQPQGSGWVADGDRYYYAQFGPDLPDLNLANAAVTAEITGDAAFWLDDVGVDGFRLDAAKYLIEDGAATENTPETHAWWRTFRTTLQGQRPDALFVGEVWDLPKVSASYVPDDLDLTFDFAVDTGYVGAAQTGDGASVERLLTNVTRLYPASGGFGAFLSNHDMDRVASQLGADPGRLGVAADLLLTGPGVPFVYYGEEIGMTGAKPDERIRTPMRWDTSEPAAGFSTAEPWEPLSADPASVNVAAESRDPASLLNRYRRLVALRAAHPALASGTWTAVASDVPSVVAALRTSPVETALVLTNVATTPVSPTLSLASGPLCGAPTVEAVLGDGPVTPPVVTAAGGFAGYRPVASIPAQSTVVIILGR
jgi:glycosidase